MADIKVMYSKKSDNWKTPEKLYRAIMNKGYFDPCPYNSPINGLLYNLYNTKIYVNPPFSQMKVWIDWILEQQLNNCDIILLIPARTDTKYFHEILLRNPDIYFIKGRLHYNESEKKRSFP